MRVRRDDGGVRHARRRRTPTSAVPPRDPRKRGPLLFWFTLALIALAEGTLGILDLAGAPIIDSAYPALALGITAVMLLVGAFYGRAGGLIPSACWPRWHGRRHRGLEVDGGRDGRAPDVGGSGGGPVLRRRR